MVVCSIAGFFIVAALISAAVTFGLGLDNDGMQYDWIQEKWVFVPSREDIVLSMIIKS